MTDSFFFAENEGNLLYEKERQALILSSSLHKIEKNDIFFISNSKCDHFEQRRSLKMLLKKSFKESTSRFFIVLAEIRPRLQILKEYNFDWFFPELNEPARPTAARPVSCDTAGRAPGERGADRATG